MTLTEHPQPDPKHRTLYNILNRSTVSNTSYSNEYRRRTALDISELIYDISTALRISPETQQTAAQYYVTAADNDLIAGASQEATVGAALRAATMNHNDPRPLGHIADAVDESTKSIRTKLSQLMQVIDIDYIPVEPNEYIEFIADELNIDNDHPAINRATDILHQKRDADESFFYSKSPIAVAGGALYGALRFDPIDTITQRDVANACHVSEVSIRNHYQPLLEAYSR